MPQQPDGLTQTLTDRFLGGTSIAPQPESLLQRLKNFVNGAQQPTTPTIGPRKTGVFDSIRQLVGKYADAMNAQPAIKVMQSPFGLLTGGGEGDLAGLPFNAYKAAGKVNLLTHGTPTPFEKFDYSKNDWGDVLGWMVHAAEDDPNYSADYALRKMKHANYGDIPHPSDFEGWDDPNSPNELTAKGEKDYMEALDRAYTGANVIPIEPQAKNVLDLVEPKEDDMAAALAAMEPYRRKDAIADFKYMKRMINRPDEYPGVKREFDTRKINGVMPENPATTYLAHNLKMTPQEFANSPFDAIRYHDMDKKSWAIPEGTPMKTPWGSPLTNDPRELQVIRNEQSGGGELQLPKTKLTPSEKLRLKDLDEAPYSTTDPDNAYTSVDMNKMLKLAEEKGINYHILPNYDAVKKALLDHYTNKLNYPENHPFAKAIIGWLDSIGK